MRWSLTLFCISLLNANAAVAQQANIGALLSGVGSGFFEQSGVGFNVNGPGFFFRQNSFDLAVPPFGGFTPGAGATFGFGTPLGNGGSAAFNFGFGQGSRSSMTSQSPSVTLGNGGFGGFSDAQWTPFVAGAIPVVGDGQLPPANTSLLQERLSRLPHERTPHQQASVPTDSAQPTVGLDPFQQQLSTAQESSAGSAIASVDEIKRQRAAERTARETAANAEIEKLISQAEAAAAAGKRGVARIYFQQAARRADGELKTRLLERAAE